MIEIYGETIVVLGSLLGIGQYVAAFVAVGGLARLSFLMAMRALP